ncbi:hypothetical protein EJP81_21835 [Rahnella aquatilis]|nr:hypothetical protein D3Z09_22485 [Rahnella aquatilis]MQB55999.1 hypothetical protein [Rahnella sp. RcJ3]AZP44327.1 hypothetical protein EJP79_21835 [Rahnella aquatilis]AZP48663.1 hypothetical protein EJP81_21835 [Rahnella aquatilis]AZP53073.1 hypothetical protein EJP80_22285 [Rahnella aquatilis]
MSEFNRDISRFSLRHCSFCYLELTSPGTTDLPDIFINAIILAGIALLLNLYAKKFRCPDVLTSINPDVTLYILILRNSSGRNDYDAQASHHCRGQWPEQ